MESQSGKRILVVTESASVTERILRVLEPFADSTLVVAAYRNALPLLRAEPWQLVVFHTAEEISEALDLLVNLQADEIVLAAILIADHPSVEDAVMAMRSGYSSLVKTESLERTLQQSVVQGLLKTSTMRTLAENRAQYRAALPRAQARVTAMEHQIDSLQQETMYALLSALEIRESNTRTHSLRLRAYATYLARVINYPATLIPHLQSACMLHDIAKLEIPYEILSNPGVLPASQLEVLKPHTLIGERILNGITFLRPAARLVRHHHERWDGSGYPDRLSGERIPLGSRIISIVDALDAITNEQTYRPAQSYAEGVQEISRWSGRQFDPVLIAEFRRIPVNVWQELRDEVEQEFSSRQQSLNALRRPAA